MWALCKRWDFWFGLLGALGFAFAIFTYEITNKVGRISYGFDTQKVFDPANLSGFTLVNAEKEPIQQSVYATEIVVWNSGDLSLSDNSDRVREPLKVSLNGMIYYFIVSKVNLVDVANYRIEIAEDKSGVVVNWKFFDPGQGIRLTILHSDKGEPKIAVSGRFFDAVLREEAKSTIGTQSNSVFPLFMGLVVMALSSIIIWAEWTKDRTRIDRISIGFGVLMISQGILLIGSYYYGLYFATVSPV